MDKSGSRKLKKKMDMTFAVIDLEGIIERTGGSSQRKETTCWIKKGSVITVNPLNNESEFYTFEIQMPPWEHMTNTCRRQWKYTHKIHKLKWDWPGEKYETVLHTVKDMIKGTRLFAKGTILENRFINDLGMQGEHVVYKEVKHYGEIKVENLTHYGCPKYPEVYHDPEREVSCFLGFIMSNLSIFL